MCRKIQLTTIPLMDAEVSIARKIPMGILRKWNNTIIVIKTVPSVGNINPRLWLQSFVAEIANKSENLTNSLIFLFYVKNFFVQVACDYENSIKEVGEKWKSKDLCTDFECIQSEFEVSLLNIQYFFLSYVHYAKRVKYGCDLKMSNASNRQKKKENLTFSKKKMSMENVANAL